MLMNFFKERFNYKLTVYALLILLMIGIGLGALRLYLLHEAFHAHTESLLQVEKKLALLSGIDHFASIPSIEGKLSYRDASPLLLQIQNTNGMGAKRQRCKRYNLTWCQMKKSRTL